MSLFIDAHSDAAPTKRGLRDVIVSMRYEDLVAYAEAISNRRPGPGPITCAVLVAAARDLVAAKPAETKKP